MESFEMVVELSSNAWVGCDKNDEKHSNNDPTGDHVDESIFLLVRSPFLCGKDGIRHVPGSSSNSSATMETSVMKDLGQSFPNRERPRMRSQHDDFVAKVHEFFLSKQDAYHEVCRSCAGGVSREDGGFRGDDEGNEHCQVGDEYERKDSSVSRSVFVWRGLARMHDGL